MMMGDPSHTLYYFTLCEHSELESVYVELSLLSGTILIICVATL